MIKFKLHEWKTEARLITSESELPNWFNTDILYLDLETTSGDIDKDSLHPWINCQILGISILVDDTQYPYYIPLRHRGKNETSNLSIEVVHKWLQKVLDGARIWVNHNIKYDAHVLQNSGFKVTPKLIDSIVLCKLSPREERFRYGLTEIMDDWFYTNIEPYEERIKLNLKVGRKISRDYGIIPINETCQYACVDVLSVRRIYKELIKELPAECNRVWELENQVTRVLFDMENIGFRVDRELIERHCSEIPQTLYVIESQLARATKFDGFRPHTNADCKELFVKRLGLPILEYTDGGKGGKKEASFSKNAILAYKTMQPDLALMCDMILLYKKLHTIYGFFTVPYSELNIDGVMHCLYNQIVRTGRMACNMPNMQQLSVDAKAYIIPGTGLKIIDIDYSQIEFRLIAHFIKAEIILKQYRENPNTDYHVVTSKLCKIDRQSAKRINFMLGYGGGRGKCIEILSSVPAIIEELGDKTLIEARANQVYQDYHNMVPTLKQTMWQASNVVRQRGYIRTILGRHRHLPKKAHYKAFNTVVQGSAADLFKAALVRLHAYLQNIPDVKLIGAVHDSFVLIAPIDYDPTPLIEVVEQIPEGINLRVPIRADVKSSSINWSQCE